MKHFRILMLLCLGGGLLLAQTQTARIATSFGTGVDLPAFFPPAPAAAVAAQAKAYARFYALLTPAQKQKLDSLTALPGAMTVVSSGANQ